MKIPKTFDKFLVGGAFLLAVAFVPQANAGPFTYDTDAGWIEGSETCSGTCPGDIAFSSASDFPGGFNTMTWVVGSSPQSSLTVESFAGGGEADGATLFPSFKFTHVNNIIPTAFDWEADLGLAFDITLPGPGGGTFSIIPPLTFNVDFTETLNTEPCPSDNTGSIPCEDRFTAMTIGGIFGEIMIMNDLATYFFSIDPADVVVDNAFVELSPAGDLTVYTAEGTTSMVTFNFTGRQEPKVVPAPTAMVLLGLGLLGLGFAGRRRKV